MLIYSNNEGWFNLILNYIILFIYCNNTKTIPNFSLRYELNNFNIFDFDIRKHLCEICDMDYTKTEINFTNNDNLLSIYLSFNYLIDEGIVKTNYLSEDYTISEETHYIINKTEEIEKIIELLISQKNRTDLDNGIDTEIIKENIIITLTTTHNQKNNGNINKTTIDFGQCENVLKNTYNISFNNSLYIIKLEIKEEGMKIPKTEYEVYYPLYNNELEKLNLITCKDLKITLSIPVPINEDINKYNTSSNYYNDICSKTTSKSGTDIPLTDRKNEFINDNMSLCEEDCDLIDYDYDNKKAKCSCLTKIKKAYEI